MKGCIKQHPPGIKERVLDHLRSGMSAEAVSILTGIPSATIKGWRIKEGIAPVRNKTKPFPNGTLISALTILEQIADGPHAEDILYRIIYDCCGNEAVINHKRVLDRRSNRAQWCPDCARVSGGKKSHHVEPPVRVIERPMDPARHLAMSGAWR